MKPLQLLASAAILACTAVAWLVLGAAVTQRADTFSRSTSSDVGDVWGPPLTQTHPSAFFLTPNGRNGRTTILPTASTIETRLSSEPKKRGLLWHKTYQLHFSGTYQFTNPTRIPQTLYVRFILPEASRGLHEFTFDLGGENSDKSAPAARDGIITRAIPVPAGGTVPLTVSYLARGTDSWNYQFPDSRRITDFKLTMSTDFPDINFPTGTGSPTHRKQSDTGWNLAWDYPDVLNAHSIGMDMPEKLNAGPVAARMAFFAPVSLLFFVTVILLIGGMRGISLHPVHVFFISAGFFAFQLLFAYLVDLLPIVTSFTISALVSLALVSGYLRAVGGNALFKIALPAQLAYMVLFSASFFFHGLTGITITCGAIATLAILMTLTAKVDWKTVFTSQKSATA